MSEHPNKQYLGDGAYIKLGDYHGEVIVTTENGIAAQNTIHLGPAEIDALVRYLQANSILAMPATEGG